MKNPSYWLRLKLSSLGIFAHLVLSGVAAASTAGFELAKHYKDHDIGWGSSVADMVIVLRDPHGNERQRDLRTFYYELDEDGDKSIVVFDSPGDVKGTAFLTYSHIEGEDEQWMYLPEIKRVKRISSRNKSGAFMGSEFAYEDFGSFELGKYDFVRRPDETVDGTDCFVLEAVPTYANSGYSKIVKWIDKENVRLVKNEYYDKKGDIMKTLHSNAFRLYEGRYWRALNSVMVNHRNGMVTELVVSSYDFGIKLEEQYFTKNNLKRIR